MAYIKKEYKIMTSEDIKNKIDYFIGEAKYLRGYCI